MTIQRFYEPDPEALDRVVEILYRMLIEPPGDRMESPESACGEVERTTCVSTEAEG